MKYPLHESAWKGDLETVVSLIAEGADVNAPDRKGCLVMNHAALSGNVDLCRFLLESGADLHATDKEGKTALHWAASGKNDVLRLLLRYGADVNCQTQSGYTALHEAAAHANRARVVETVEILLAAGADIHARTNHGTTALTSAVIGHKLSLVKYLIFCGADVDARSYGGETPLLVAAKWNLPDEMVTLLLDHGADIGARDQEGRTVLHLVAMDEHSTMAEVFLSHGAEIDARDANGKTPLMYSCGTLRRGWATIRTEVNSAPETNKNLETQSTATQKQTQRTRMQGTVANQKRAQMVQFWLNHGADLNACDEQGMTARDYAIRQGRSEIVHALDEFGSGS